MVVARLASSVLLAILVTGCGSSSDPVLYTLAAQPGPTARSGPHVIALRDVGLAQYLDRPEIVRASENYLLDVSKGDWWGEPLGRMIDRVLAEELSQRLPGSTVIASSGAIGADADTTIEVNVQSFAANGAGQVVLDAQAAITRARGKPTLLTKRLTATPTDSSTRAQVAAMSQLLGQFADVLAAAVKT